MYKLSDEVKESIDKKLNSTLGMSYEEFKLFDFDEQQTLLSNCRSKKLMVRVMVGSGEDAFFISVKRGTRIKTPDGYIIAGDTEEEYRLREEKRVNEILNEDKNKGKVLSIFKGNKRK